MVLSLLIVLVCIDAVHGKGRLIPRAPPPNILISLTGCLLCHGIVATQLDGLSNRARRPVKQHNFRIIGTTVLQWSLPVAVGL